VQGVIRGKEAREEVKVLTAEQEAAERKEKEDSSASSVQGVIRGKEAREEVKVMNAEQEAAEKAHVAEMHSSASKIQGVIHGKETRGQTDELSRQRDIEILDEQTQAAIVIQTRARGYNTRVFMQKEVAAMHEHRAAMEARVKPLREMVTWLGPIFEAQGPQPAFSSNRQAGARISGVSSVLPAMLEAVNELDDGKVIQMIRESGGLNKKHPTEFDLRQAAVQIMASANVQDPQGFSPLHYAARKPNALVVKALLSAKADPLLKDKNGTTPLDMMSMFNPHYLDLLENSALYN